MMKELDVKISCNFHVFFLFKTHADTSFKISTDHFKSTLTVLSTQNVCLIK